MKKILVELVSLLAVACAACTAVQAQSGFAYQAVVRNVDGTLVSNANVGMRFTLMCDTMIFYQETQKVQTNEYGVASVVINGNDSKPVIGNFSQIPWGTKKVMLQVEADIKGTEFYINYGKTEVASAPYSLYAASAPVPTEIVASADSKSETAIFSVLDKDGNPVFAVYPSGVKVFVDGDTVSKARRSGFLVAGRSAKDGEDEVLFAVDGTGTQVYVDADDTKARRSGFLVAGRSAKGADDLFSVDADGTKVYVDDSDDKARRSGFLVAGRSAKNDESEYLVVDANGTQVYFDDTDDKARRSGFLVAGRSAKSGESDEMFVVDGEGTQVYIDADDKARRSGFLVAGRSAKDGEDDMFVVDGEGTKVYFDADDKARRSGFLVAGRSAKDGVNDDLFVVDGSGTQVYIDDDDKAGYRGFLVRSVNDDVDNSRLLINSQKTTLSVNASSEKTAFAIVDVETNKVLTSIANEILKVGVDMNVPGNIDYHTKIDKMPEIDLYLTCIKGGDDFNYSFMLPDLLGVDYNNWIFDSKGWDYDGDFYKSKNGHLVLSIDEYLLSLSVVADDDELSPDTIVFVQTTGEYDAKRLNLIVNYEMVDDARKAPCVPTIKSAFDSYHAQYDVVTADGTVSYDEYVLDCADSMVCYNVTKDKKYLDQQQHGKRFFVVSTVGKLKFDKNKNEFAESFEYYVCDETNEKGDIISKEANGYEEQYYLYERKFADNQYLPCFNSIGFARKFMEEVDDLSDCLLTGWTTGAYVAMCQLGDTLMTIGKDDAVTCQRYLYDGVAMPSRQSEVGVPLMFYVDSVNGRVVECKLLMGSEVRAYYWENRYKDPEYCAKYVFKKVEALDISDEGEFHRLGNIEKTHDEFSKNEDRFKDYDSLSDYIEIIFAQ